MPKVGVKQTLEQDVLSKAKERVSYLFDAFDRVVVSFSGGKDSTCVLNLALEEARRRGRTPLEVISYDEEAIPPETVEYMRRVSQSPDVDFYWFCVPIKHRNACSTRHDTWYPWLPADRKKWVRELPPEAIVEIEGMELGEGIPELNERLFAKSKGRVALLLGIRSQESISRYRAVAMSRGDLAWIKDQDKHISKCYPIYDWTTDDVWIATEVEGWDYNRAYDLMTRMGVSLHSQRCAPPFGEQPIRGLWQFKQAWPHLWNKMVDRVHGAATAARYATTALYGRGLNKQDDSGESDDYWQTRCFSRLSMLNPAARAEVASMVKACIAEHYKFTNQDLPDKKQNPKSGYSWKLLYKGVAAGGNKFGRQLQKLNLEAMNYRNKGKSDD